jgi:hypothetical protein
VVFASSPTDKVVATVTDKPVITAEADDDVGAWSPENLVALRSADLRCLLAEASRGRDRPCGGTD